MYALGESDDKISNSKKLKMKTQVVVGVGFKIKMPHSSGTIQFHLSNSYPERRIIVWDDSHPKPLDEKDTKLVMKYMMENN